MLHSSHASYFPAHNLYMACLYIFTWFLLGTVVIALPGTVLLTTFHRMSWADRLRVC